MKNISSNIHSHKRVTGLSGNEIYCLKLLGLEAGTICIGNSVFSIGLIGGITSGLRTLAGGEVTEITNLISEGRKNSINRMYEEAKNNGGVGITGVATDLIIHNSNIEFLTVASTVHNPAVTAEKIEFSSSGDAQRLYCQIDAGFIPKKYVFGNVAYSIGVAGGIGGFLKSLGRGEVPQYTEIFDRTRHLALSRIMDEAKACGANSVLGVETTITHLMGAQEMVMIGTASSHPALEAYRDNPVTSDMTNQELWNMINIGYIPLRIVMGVSVYSLGFTGGITSALSSLAKGEISELTTLLYDAREKSLDRLQQEAERWGADEVVGVKTHIYELGGGLIEFLALGTAVKKVPDITTKNRQLPPQAIIVDEDTHFESQNRAQDLGRGKRESARSVQGGPLSFVVTIVVVFLYLFLKTCSHIR